VATRGAHVERLDADQLRKIHHGLRSSLRARHFDEALIDRCAEDAVGKSLVELTEAQLDGKDIPDPIAWVVKVSIWRSIDRLRGEEREAAAPFSEEVISDVADPRGALPEEAALDNVEAAELHRVVSTLPEDQREALRSYYFWELSTRAGAKQLHWSEPTFRRRLKAAMNSLRDRFGVPEQGDVFAIELGLATAISLTKADAASAGGVGDQIVAAAEAVRGATSHAAGRVRDLLARVIPGAGTGKEHPLDPVVVSRAAETASGPSGAVAGKVIGGGCTVLAAVCAATGVIGPGLGGVIGLLHRGGTTAVPAKVKALPQPTSRAYAGATSRPRTQARRRRSHATASTARPSRAGAPSERALGDESGTRAERTHSSTRSFGAESEVTPPEPVAAAPAPATSSAPSESASNPTQEANAQFAP